MYLININTNPAPVPEKGTGAGTGFFLNIWGMMKYAKKNPSQANLEGISLIAATGLEPMTYGL